MVVSALVLGRLSLLLLGRSFISKSILGRTIIRELALKGNNHMGESAEKKEYIE